VTPLAEALDAAIFGGKAAELGRALRTGLPVPGGVALAPERVTSISRREPEAMALLDAMLAAAGGRAAVRSSAIGEDGASASFAGMHATVLHVTSTPALADAIERVWASARTEAALAYRRRMGIVGEPRMAVVVQSLIDAECAGVLFTRNPMSGSDERVIEAAWGLGEAVVAGLVTPDRYRIARDGTVLERTAGDKDVAVRCVASGGTAEVEVPVDRVRALALDDARLARLHALASACEAYADGPHDIEWAFAGEALFLLQRRAVTRSATATATATASASPTATARRV
jgi:pyruvate,water dikinase